MESIVSLQNPKVKHLAKLAKDRLYRSSKGTIFVEGKKIIEELISQKQAMQLFSILPSSATFSSVEQTQISPTIAKKISPFKTSEGVFAEMIAPENRPLKGHTQFLILDRIKDPGNLGTLIRSAVAFGYTGVFILENSTDPYSPKAIRASMGAVFHLQIQQGNYGDLQKLLMDLPCKVYVADAKGANIQNITVEQPHALVLGNESSGPNMSKMPQHQLVSIPIEQVDSLNVAIAGSILMHQMGSPICQ